MTSGPAPFPRHLLAPEDPVSLPLPPVAHPAPGVRLLRGAVYALREGARPLAVDLWLPPPGEGGEAPPVVVFVHGGGWRTGRRDDPGPRLRAWRPGPFARLAQAGFAVACPDYRLSGEAPHPAQTHDLADALAWLHARARELGVDTGRTVLWGESAGGHLAALTALDHHLRRDEAPATALASATVTGCVTWYAPTDFEHLAEDCPPGRYDPRDPGTPEALLLGAAPADAPDRARAAGPVARVTPGAPPFLVLHGTDDALIPVRQAVRLADALRGAGVEVELRLVERGDHLWVGLSDGEVEECFLRTLAFFRARTARADN
ncbi:MULTISPECIES: alpha/beta hydrolase [unclassified Streptomyces]|uniref:alpha/beta hydrolase n=1 Tax=unclassified Streptomyces TaxID=2593676 RepID=UPI0033BF649E